MRAAAALTVVGMLALAAPLHAQSVEDFYKGKQIRIVVGSAAGNDYDLWARLIGRHLVRHIPGNPTVVVENMPGAGTLVATNHLFNVAPRDGTVIGMVSRSMPAAAVMKVANVRFDPEKFNWLGSPEVNHLVLYINNNAGIAKVPDLLERPLIVAGTGPAQGITVGPLMLKNLLGLKFKVVTGYRGPSDMALAAQRGEVQAFANTIGGPAGARRPWVESGQMRVLFNFEPDAVPGLGVPSIFEFLKTDEQRRVMTFFAGNVLLGRPLMTTPGVPAERVAALRRALGETFKDPEFLKEAHSMSFEPAPLNGERIAALVAELVATPPAVVQMAERAARAE
jgi:tripartite-type tricarboxylate transporter receptor subunit TctC